MNAIVIYNARSGSAIEPELLKQKIKEAGITVARLIDITTISPDKLRSVLVKEDATVIVYGGDGTINSVARILIDTKLTLAPLPGGTLNHFTKDLGIPQDIDEAIQRLKSAKVQSIDIAHVNSIYFLNNSSIGIYPISLRERAKYEKYIGKWPAAFIASIRALIRFRIYEIIIDKKHIRTPFVFIGNNYYDPESGMQRASLREGKLYIYTVRSTKRRTLIKLMLLILIGRIDNANELEISDSSAITIHTKRSSVRVAADGEHFKINTPLNYKSEHGKLRVL